MQAGTAAAMTGMPIAQKDLFCTEGVRTTAASKILGDFDPPYESTVSGKLKADGAVLLGKANLDEFAMGSANITSAFGPVTNPWTPEGAAAPLTPGGSSGGSAALVAAGAAIAATGTDTGGSIRIPAAFCGVVGIKPSYGLVSLRGLFPLSGSLDHAGPMARSSKDCALLLDAVMGPDAKDPTSTKHQIEPVSKTISEDCRGLVIGHVTNFSEAEGVSDESSLACHRALDVFRDLGAEVKEIQLPSLWDYTVANTTIMTSEAFAIHNARFRDHLDDVSYLTRHRIALGAFISAADYIKAQKARRVLTHTTFDLMRENRVDLLCYPGMVSDPPPIDQMSPFYYLKAPLITAPASLPPKVSGPLLAPEMTALA